MTTPLTWTFRGVDAISRPAQSAVASLRALKTALTGVRRDGGGRLQATWMSQLRGQARQLRREFSASSGALGTFAAGVAGAGAVASVGVAAVGRSVVELAGFQQSAETALAASLGSSTEAAQAFREAITIANQTPLDTRDVVQAMQGLASAGFNTLTTMRPMLGILTDVGATHGADAMSRFSLALGQVQARGALTMEELNQLREAAPSIARPLMAALGTALNISGPNAGAQVQAAISARRVTAEMLNNALGTAGAQMNAGTGGGLGGIARAQSQTLVGSLSNVSNAWDNLLMSFGTGSSSLAQSQGLTTFRGFIDSITSALDASTPRGQRAIAVLKPLIDGVFGAMFAGTPGTSIIDTVISGVRDATPLIVSLVAGVRGFADGVGGGFMGAIEPAIDLLRQFGGEGATGGNTMRDLGRAVGFLAGAFVMGVGVISFAASGITMIFTDLPATLQLVWNDIVEMFTVVPGQMVDGFLATLTERWRGLVSTVKGLAQQLPAGVRQVLGIRSPSRVFAEIGLHTTAGMVEGLTAGQTDVQRAIAAIAAPPSNDTAPAGGTGVRGGPASVQVTFVLDGRRDAQGIVDEAEERLSNLFTNLFERAALATG